MPPTAVARTIGFLAVPPASAEAQRLFDEDVADLGYVMNVSRPWVWGGKLAAASGGYTAASVLGGNDHGLSASGHAMADWARKVARDPIENSG